MWVMFYPFHNFQCLTFNSLNSSLVWPKQNVDLDKNIAIGDRYEDVVYVKDGKFLIKFEGKSKSAKASRFAKK